MARKSCSAHDALVYLNSLATGTGQTILDLAEQMVNIHEEQNRRHRMSRSPVNLAMLRIALSQSVLDEGAHVVAHHPDGIELPVVATGASFHAGRSTFRLELGL